MTLTVRLPNVLEENLAEYCVAHGVNRSEAVKRAITRLVSADSDVRTPYDLGRDLFGPETDVEPSDDIAANTQRLLREKFRPQ